MSKKVTAVIVGKFQPYTSAHQHITDSALDEHDYVVVLVAGSNVPRSRRNPWSWTERADMVISAHPGDEHRLQVMPLHDNEDDKAWLRSIKGLAEAASPPGNELVLFNSRPTLDKIDGWKSEPHEWPIKIGGQGLMHSADIRKLYFEVGSFEAKVENDVPLSTLARMQQFIDGRLLDSLRAQGDSWV